MSYTINDGEYNIPLQVSGCQEVYTLMREKIFPLVKLGSIDVSTDQFMGNCSFQNGSNLDYCALKDGKKYVYGFTFNGNVVHLSREDAIKYIMQLSNSIIKKCRPWIFAENYIPLKQVRYKVTIRKYPKDTYVISKNKNAGAYGIIMRSISDDGYKISNGVISPDLYDKLSTRTHDLLLGLLMERKVQRVKDSHDYVVCDINNEAYVETFRKLQEQFQIAVGDKFRVLTKTDLFTNECIAYRKTVNRRFYGCVVPKEITGYITVECVLTGINSGTLEHGDGDMVLCPEKPKVGGPDLSRMQVINGLQYKKLYTPIRS